MLYHMLEPDTLDEVSKKLAAVIPAGLQHLREDLQKSVRAVLQGTLTQMNLVSREEFDVQCEVLARTRAKLDALEAQVAELEKRLPSR
jgi:hypothetical protein